MAIVIDIDYKDIKEDISFTNLLLYGLLKSKMTPILTTYSIFKNLKTINEDCLKSEEWKVYIRGEYILLIPINYINDLQESDLGLNLHHFCENKDLIDKINQRNIYDEISNNIKSLEHEYLYPSLLFFKSKQFVKFLNLLFKSKSESNFAWNIYMAGHGSPFFVTCNLYEDCFRDFLYILEYKINTKVLYYNSCFSGGKMSDFIYNSEKPLKFSYPIFCQSLTDAPTAAFFSFDFTDLIKKLMLLKVSDENSIIDLVSNIYDQYENLGTNTMNLVLLRRPSSDKFEAIDIEDKIFVISDLKKDQEYNIAHKYLIISQPIIKNTVKVNENTKIISIAKGDSYNYLEKIDINFWYIDLFINFNFVDELRYKKIFLIKEINCLDKENKELKLKNVIIFLNSYTPISKHEKKEFEAFGIDSEDNGFIIDINKYNSNCGFSQHSCYHFEKNIINENLKKEYISIYNRIKERIDKEEQPNKKMYEKEFRNFSIVIKQSELLLKPILITTLICKFLNLKKINEYRFFDFLKNYLVCKFIYRFIVDKLIDPKLSSIYDKFEMPIF